LTLLIGRQEGHPTCKRVLFLGLMNVKKITSFCQGLKKMQKIGSFFLPHAVVAIDH